MINGTLLAQAARSRRTRLHAAVAASLFCCGSLSAQRPDPLPPATADTLARGTTAPAAREQVLGDGHVLRWYEPLAVLGVIALTTPLDEPVANHFRDHRSQTGQDLADAWAKLATLGVGVVTAGVLAGGLISHNDKVAHTGLRLLFSAAVAGGAAEAIKFALGRERPFENTSAWDFDAGHFNSAFPSGHATLAFAMAASLSDDIHRTWATVGLYGAATGVALARVYQQEHWVSDVVGGAAVGIASAKLMSGRWRIFGLRPPGFLATPAGAGLGYHVSF